MIDKRTDSAVLADLRADIGGLLIPRLLRHGLLGIVGVLATVTIVVAALNRLGLPLTLYTWLVVILCASSGATLSLPNLGLRAILFCGALLACTYLLMPKPFQRVPGIEVWSLFDDVGGRSEWGLTPWLRFGTDGPNTALLESYVGSLEPHWWYQAPHSPYIRDGNERVHSRSIIRHEQFSQILELLPDEDSRRTVIQCLTDKDNRLRAHQGFLLACLGDLKYPAGMDRDSWWSRHRHVFRIEHDPFVAASMAQGWLDAFDRIDVSRSDAGLSFVQFHAASNQEQGAWGGHYDFGEAFIQIDHGHRPPDSKAERLGQQVVWWPELVKEAAGEAP